MLASTLAAQPRKVRFSVSAASIAEVPFRIAHVKGFYRDEGLEVESHFHPRRRWYAGAARRLGRLYFGLGIDHRRRGARHPGKAGVYRFGKTAI